MADKIKLRRGLRADLPTLEEGELGFCTDTKELFIGSDEGNILINGAQSLTPPNTSNLMVSNKTENSISFIWNAVVGADSYNIERNGILVGNTSGTSYTVSNLEPDTAYTFAVKSKNTEGLSSGTSITVTTLKVVIIAQDSFNRPDSPTLGTLDSGQTWNVINTSGNATYEIVGNQAVMTFAGGHASRNFAYIDPGVSDFSIKVTMSVAIQGGIIFRAKNQSNPVEFLRMRANGGNYELAHYRGASVDGTITASTIVHGTSSVTSADGDIVEVQASGANVKVYINGSLQIQASIPELTSERLVGLNGGGGGMHYFDNFIVSQLITAPNTDAPIDEGVVDANQDVDSWIGGIE